MAYEQEIAQWQQKAAMGVPGAKEMVEQYQYAQAHHKPAMGGKLAKAVKIGAGVAAGGIGLAALGGGAAAAGAGAGGGATGTGAAAAEGASAMGATDWLKRQLSNIDAGDVLTAGAAGVGTYYDAKQAAADREERARQFDELLHQRQSESTAELDRFNRTQGNTEAQIGVQAQTALNKAPMADKATALLMSRMGAAPSTFAPRDWTQNVNNVRGSATGGPAADMATARTAAASYQPGQGGVDTSALQMLRDKMLGSAGMSAPRPPGAPSTGRPAPIVRGPRPVNRYAY